MRRFELALPIVLALAGFPAAAKEPAPLVVDKIEWILRPGSIIRGVRDSGVMELSAGCDGRKMSVDVLVHDASKLARAGGPDGRRVESREIYEDDEGNAWATFVSSSGDGLHAAATKSPWIEISGEGWSYRIQGVPNAAFERLYARCSGRPKG